MEKIKELLIKFQEWKQGFPDKDLFGRNARNKKLAEIFLKGNPDCAQSQWISAQNLPEKAGTYIAKTKLYFNGVDWEDQNEDYFDNNNVIEYIPQPPQ